MPTANKMNSLEFMNACVGGWDYFEYLIFPYVHVNIE